MYIICLRIASGEKKNKIKYKGKKKKCKQSKKNL